VFDTLPFLGGHATIHDWHWLLREVGLLDSTAEIAGLIKALG
jgi:hypothetical protein